MKPLKNILHDLLKPVAKKNGFMKAKIILDWEKIVGPEFASFCRPIKLIFPLKYQKNGTLYLMVTPSYALILDHSKDLLVEKVNTYFGYSGIQTIKTIQGPLKHSSPLSSIANKGPSQEEQAVSYPQTPQERLQGALKDLEKALQYSK